MFASYDSTAPQPTPVTGWFDTQTPAMQTCANADILELSQSEWDNRLATPYVNNGILVAAPKLTAKQRLINTQDVQITTITQSCADAIIAGFTSSALGTVHTYPSQPNDQTNLISAVASGLPNVPFWCADLTGVWGIVAHTDVQIKQVLVDGGTTRIGYSAKLAALVTRIRAATTVADVQAIVW